MIKVTPRARRHPDRAGDPLDGLVNLFDVGIVLAVAFLIAALSSLHLTDRFTQHGADAGAGAPVTVAPGQTSGPVPPAGSTVIGSGDKVGSVYRLSDGTLVYVTDPGSPTPAPSPSR